MEYYIIIHLTLSYSGDVPYIENGKVKMCDTKKEAKNWIKEHPDIFSHTLYTIKSL